MTTDAEAHRMADEALARWGGSERPIRLVKNRENIVFEVWLPGGRRAALRLHRPGYQSAAAINAELVWTMRLKEHGLGVPEPLPMLDGNLLATLENGRQASCVGWLSGDPIGCAEEMLTGSAADQRALFVRLGALIARLHNLTDAGAIPAEFPRPHWNIDGLLGTDPLWGRFWENPSFSESDRDLILEARSAAREDLARFITEGADIGPIHADVLRENVLEDEGRLLLIDFDDSGIGFRNYDLATAIVQSLEEPNLPLLVEGLIEGYRSHRPLEEFAARRLALFIGLRTFASAGWIITRAAPDDSRQRFYAARAIGMAHHILQGTTPWSAEKSI